MNAQDAFTTDEAAFLPLVTQDILINKLPLKQLIAAAVFARRRYISHANSEAQ